MNKEDILNAAQKEKNKGKEYENKSSVKSGLIGTLAALIIGFILFIFEYKAKGTMNISLIAVVLIGAGADWLFEGIKLRKVLKIVLGAIYFLLGLVFVIAYIGKVIG